MKPESISLLATRAAGYQPRVDGNPLASLTASDIAAACARLHPQIVSHVIRAKYTGDARAARAVLARLKGQCIDVGHGPADRLSEAVLKAWLIPPLCPTCHGRAQVRDGDLTIVCPECAGEGYQATEKLSDRGLILLSGLYRWEQQGIRIILSAMQENA